MKLAFLAGSLEQKWLGTAVDHGVLVLGLPEISKFVIPAQAGIQVS
jgi:hypothetical protein